MMPRICIIGYHSFIDIAKQVASEFGDEAEFTFINCLLEESLPFLREVEGVADIVLAGPLTKKFLSTRLKIPVFTFRPTLPDLILAIQEARRFDKQIALFLTPDDRNLDISLLSNATNVSFLPLFCGGSKEQERACKVLKEKGCKVVIGGSYAVEVAEKIGLKGILTYTGKDSVRTAIKNAHEFCRVYYEGIRHASQFAAVVNHFPGGLLLTDEKGEIILDNPTSHISLGLNQLKGISLSHLFESKSADIALKEGAKVLNVIEKGNLVVNYIPIHSDERIYGLLCSFTKVDEIQDVEFKVREKLYNRGFLAKYDLDDIVGKSVVIQSCKERARVFAGTNGPILLTGESGTGKELFAHAIHRLSNQRKGPFVAINCATIPADLLESELFGYEKGAFTGARAGGKKGLIELAHKGTLFLDEITSLSYPLQAKLLRLLGEHEILKLGSDRIIPVETCIVAATNVDIESCVANRLFREDLYYRLSAFRLHIPPLRARSEDLVPLFFHFVLRFRKEIVAHLYKKRETLQKVLNKEPFKGNVRELENIAKRFCLLFGPEKHKEKIETLLESCLESKMHSDKLQEISKDLKTTVEMTEKNVLMETVKMHKHKSDASRILGVNRATLYRKLKKYGVDG